MPTKENKLESLKKQLKTISAEIEKEEHKAKASKGVLKPNEWLLVNVREVCANGSIDEHALIFFNASGSIIPMNSNFWSADSFYTSIDLELESWYGDSAKWKVKKVSASEAVKYL